MIRIDFGPLYDPSGSLRFLYDLDQPSVDRSFVYRRLRTVFRSHASTWKIPRSFIHLLDWHRPLQPASNIEKRLFALWKNEPETWYASSVADHFCGKPLAWDDRDFGLQLFLRIVRQSDRFDVAFAASCWSRNPTLWGEWVRIVPVSTWRTLFARYPHVLGFWTPAEWLQFSLQRLGARTQEISGEFFLEMVSQI